MAKQKTKKKEETTNEQHAGTAETPKAEQRPEQMLGKVHAWVGDARAVKEKAQQRLNESKREVQLLAIRQAEQLLGRASKYVAGIKKKI